MEHTIALSYLLKQFFGWHGSRTECITQLILGLIQVRTVNLAELAQAFCTTAKLESNYKRLQRLFGQFRLDFDAVALFVAGLVPLSRFPLTLDRTNWKWGKKNINVLVLGIAYKGAAFPLLWTSLPKRGNSNTAERIALMERFLRIFSIDRVRYLAADREFIGKKWLGYLIDKLVLFRIRVKNNSQVTNTRGQPVEVRNLFRDLRRGQYKILKGKRRLWGLELYVVGLKMPDGDLVIIVTQSEPETAMSDYKERWQIETLFGCLKTRGFNFEATHMTNPERIDRLMAYLAIAFAWAHIVGEWLNERCPIRMKKHQRPAQSIFAYGLGHLRHCLLGIHQSFRLEMFCTAVEQLQQRLSPDKQWLTV